MFKGSRRDREADAKSARCCARSSTPRATNCTNAIIFCNRKTDVDIVAKSLAEARL